MLLIQVSLLFFNPFPGTSLTGHFTIETSDCLLVIQEMPWPAINILAEPRTVLMLLHRRVTYSPVMLNHSLRTRWWLWERVIWRLGVNVLFGLVQVNPVLRAAPFRLLTGICEITFELPLYESRLKSGYPGCFQCSCRTVVCRFLVRDSEHPDKSSQPPDHYKIVCTI
jgi:hypothetical protein